MLKRRFSSANQKRPQKLTQKWYEMDETKASTEVAAIFWSSLPNIFWIFSTSLVNTYYNYIVLFACWCLAFHVHLCKMSSSNLKSSCNLMKYFQTCISSSFYYVFYWRPYNCSFDLRKQRLHHILFCQPASYFLKYCGKQLNRW